MEFFCHVQRSFTLAVCPNIFRFFHLVCVFQEDLWSKLMIAPLFNNSIHGDVLMRRDWIDTCLKYKPQGEVKNVIDMVGYFVDRRRDVK